MKYDTKKNYRFVYHELQGKAEMYELDINMCVFKLIEDYGDFPLGNENIDYHELRHDMESINKFGKELYGAYVAIGRDKTNRW